MTVTDQQLEALETPQLVSWALACAQRLEPFVEAAGTTIARIYARGLDMAPHAILKPDIAALSQFRHDAQAAVDPHSAGLQYEVHETLSILVYALDVAYRDAPLASAARVRDHALAKWNTLDWAAPGHRCEAVENAYMQAALHKLAGLQPSETVAFLAAQRQSQSLERRQAMAILIGTAKRASAD